MTMHERSEVSKRVTIEELLRVKRAELPTPEFWSIFEQDLRAKQLAAIIEPRPWWITLRLPQIARTMVCLQVPMGAVAVLALGFIVVQQTYSPLGWGKNNQIYSSPNKPTDVSTGISNATPLVLSHNSVEVNSQLTKIDPSESIASVLPAPKSGMVPRIAVLASLPTGTGELLAMIPWAAPQQDIAVEPVVTPFKLGELPKESFASAIKPAGDHDFASRMEVDPVAIVTATREEARDPLDIPVQASPVSPREVRRNHILSNLIVADSGTDVARVHVAHDHEVSDSLNDDRLYDSVRRVGMGGDRLTLKF